MSHYFKFVIPYEQIHSYLKDKYKNVIFHIDLASIARGFYNKDVVHFEISNYIQSRRLPNILFEEAKEFYGKLAIRFNSYNPKFITFYDKGKNQQNKGIEKTYKGDRGSTAENLLLEDEQKEIYYAIKNYYYDEFNKRFQIPNLSKVIFLDEYETDFIPFYLIQNNINNQYIKDTLNIILSTDKDLLQTCKYQNVIQVISSYSKKEGKLKFDIFHDQNAIAYIWKNFKPGILTSKYIPLILALSGDKADNIPGIEGVGPAAAYKLINMYKLPTKINSQTELPEKLENHRKLIMHNLELIDFELQSKRLPYHITEMLNSIII